MEQRARELALYLIENRTTVRAAAKKFGVSKSTVHKDLSERLAACDRVLYGQVKPFWTRTSPSGISGAAWPPAAKYKGI